MWHMTCDTWHMACDMWHMSCDTWWGVNILSKFQLSSSYGLGKIKARDAKTRPPKTFICFKSKVLYKRKKIFSWQHQCVVKINFWIDTKHTFHWRWKKIINYFTKKKFQCVWRCPIEKINLFLFFFGKMFNYLFSTSMKNIF